MFGVESDRIKFVLFFITVLLIETGCSSWAYRKVDCHHVSKGFVGPQMVFIGTVFQQGPCAVIDSLRIELGTFYSRSKNNILRDLDDLNAGRIKPDSALSMREWALVLNCPKDDRELFAVILKEHQDEVFADKNSSRKTTLRAIEMIHNNPILSRECKI